MIQEKFCKEYDFNVFDAYVDDGFSGLNFDRPEFQRMLNDIENGKINLVVDEEVSEVVKEISDLH